MDGSHGYFAPLAFASNDLGNVDDCTIVSAVDFDAPHMSSSYPFNNNKRKCNAVDPPVNLKDGSSLVLGLGCSSNSCTTICSAKETEEESGVDIGLRLDLNVGDNGSFNQKKGSAGTLNALETTKPNLDLQLSLSTGPAESDVTNITQDFLHGQRYSKSLVLTPAIQLVDEGSTSSRWSMGPLLDPSRNVEIHVPLDLDRGYGVPNPAVLNLPSHAVKIPILNDSHSLNDHQVQRKHSTKTCMFEGCSKGARGASGLCIAHGGGRRCQRAGCHKGAEGKTVFCKAHGGGRRCQHLGCTKSAEGRTDYCIAHGGGRRCSHEGCTRASRGKSGLCIRHGGGKRCTAENCTRSAEGASGLCISHGGGRRCQYPDCTKGAQGSTMFCKAHGGGRRCTYLGCMKGAEGSTAFCKGHGGGKRCMSEGCTKSVHGGTLFCVRHGGGKRCAVPDCSKSARGRTNYCVRHGGGKRCKFEGCTRSAQGSTDFCKAHGGGKRCSWVQLYANPCDKFARGRSGLCATHSAQVEYSKTTESFEMVSTSENLESSVSSQMNSNFAAAKNPSCPGAFNNHGTVTIGSISYGHQPISSPIAPLEKVIVENACLDHLSLPEGRVHGGGLMAMLRGATLGRISNNQEGSSQFSHSVPHNCG